MKKGFTLIELLVVITILGILAGLTMVSYSGVQERGRDSKRKTDLDALKKTLELAKQDSTGQYYYPSCVTYTAGSCALGNTSTTPNLSSGASIYIKTVPLDPKLNVGYTYTPSPANCGASLCTSYALKACLESKTDSQGVADVSCTSGKKYEVSDN